MTPGACDGKQEAAAEGRHDLRRRGILAHGRGILDRAQQRARQRA
jgi:hypothetical protein